MRSKHTCFCAVVFLLSAILVDVAFSAQFNFTPGLILTEEYTDNLFLDPANEQEDFVHTAGVSLTGEALWRTAGIQLTYAPSYSWHADHSEQDNWRHAVDLVSWVDLSRSTRIDLTDSYLRTFVPNDQSANLQVANNPLAQPLIQADQYRRGLREYYTNVSLLRLTHNFGANDSVYIGSRYSILRETDDPVPGTVATDYDIMEPIAGMTYWFNPNWGVQLDLVYSDRNYKERNDRKQYDAKARFNRRFSRNLNGFVGYRHTYLDYNDDTLNSDVTIYSPTIGFTYLLDQNTTITLGAGYYFQNFDSDLVKDEDGPIVDAEIFKGFIFRRGRIDLIGRGGYTINDQGVEDLGLDLYYAGQVSASYSFTQKFSGILGGSYRYDEYPNEIPSRTDNTIRANAGVSYQAYSWMLLTLAYTYTDLSSDIAANEYVENRVLLTINLTSANPIHLN
jgi:hypothetical protein